MPELTVGQFQLVYNMLSLSIAAMLGSFAFFVMARQQLAPKYRQRLLCQPSLWSSLATTTFESSRVGNHAYALSATAGMYEATGQPFNDAYRYVDWLLTVPLLVAELVAVLALEASLRTRLMARLIIASTLMIGLGYPGEIAADAGTRTLFGLLSTIPFLYILFVLWVQLAKAAERNSEHTRVLLRNTQLLLLATWGFYPIAYLLPLLGIGGSSSSEVALQVGYSIADIAAKCGYGIMIYHIARSKMKDEGFDDDALLAAAHA